MLLRPTHAVHDETHTFFHDVGHDVDRVTSTRSPELTAAFTGLAVDMTDVLDHRLDEMASHRS